MSAHALAPMLRDNERGRSVLVKSRTGEEVSGPCQVPADEEEAGRRVVAAGLPRQISVDGDARWRGKPAATTFFIHCEKQRWRGCLLIGKWK